MSPALAGNALPLSHTGIQDFFFFSVFDFTCGNGHVCGLSTMHEVSENQVHTSG